MREHLLPKGWPLSPGDEGQPASTCGRLRALSLLDKGHSCLPLSQVLGAEPPQGVSPKSRRFLGPQGREWSLGRRGLALC